MQERSVGEGLSIKNLGFSANGHWLCVWAIAISEAYDQCQFWAIEQDQLELSDRIVKYHKVSYDVEDVGNIDIETRKDRYSIHIIFHITFSKRSRMCHTRKTRTILCGSSNRR